jgi:membrane protein
MTDLNDQPANVTPPAPPAPPARPAPWWRRLDEAIWAVPDQSAHTVKVFCQRWLQILDRSLRGFYVNNGFANISSLTYTTFLTLVPLLAILLVGLKGFGLHETAREALKRHPLVQQLKMTPQTVIGPDGKPVANTATVLTGEGVIDKLFDFVDNTDFGKIGAIGVAGLLLVVLSLLAKIEMVMNETWAIHRARSPGRMFVDYMNMLVVVVLIVAGMSATASGQIFTGVWAEKLGMNTAQKFFINHAPYLIIWPAFIGMYYYIPNTRVRWRSALAGGLVAGTLYQLVQFLFIHSVHLLLQSYDKIYGAFGSVLVLIFWVYLSWGIVLWGVEVCAAHQNLRELRRRRRSWFGMPVERETLALRLAALLAAPLLDPHGGKRMDQGDLADALMCPPGPLGELLELLRSNGLLIQSADDATFVLGRSPERLTVLDLLRLVRQGELEPAPPSERVFMNELADSISGPLARMTVQDLAQTPLEQIHTISL